MCWHEMRKKLPCRNEGLLFVVLASSRNVLFNAVFSGLVFLFGEAFRDSLLVFFFVSPSLFSKGEGFCDALFFEDLSTPRAGNGARWSRNGARHCRTSLGPGRDRERPALPRQLARALHYHASTPRQLPRCTLGVPQPASVR